MVDAPLDAKQYNVPWGIARLAFATLANTACTSDHVLVLADAIDQIIREALLEIPRFFPEELMRLANDLRAVAPRYANRPTIQPEPEAS